MAEKTGQREQLEDVGDTGEFAGIKLHGRRRRPSGEPPPHAYELRRSGRIWLGLFVAVLAVWVGVYASNAPDPIIQRLDDDLLSGLDRLRAGPLTSAARALLVLGSVWTILLVRWVTIVLLVVFRRWRHLVVFVASVFALRTVVAVMTTVFGRPRPPGVVILGGWNGYSHPSRPVAALAVALVGLVFSLVPRGPLRHWAFRAAGTAIAALGLARLYLATDHPSDVMFAVVLGVAFAVVAFRVWCPGAIFPVVYRTGKTAHVEIEGEREAALRKGLEEQLGLKATSIEPFELEDSAGSTPLRIVVEGENDPAVFAKLYAENHLRSDRWYKLGRTILYGSLEDERAFNSVRQLVEHEDYMLRLIRDAGIAAPMPLGIAEIQPEREYLIVTQFLERSEDAAEATIDDEVIDDALAIVQRLWGAGLAHRDIKPENVLVTDGQVTLVDAAFGQVRPSPWRQAVDLANMMLVLALATDADRVYERAAERFDPDEIAEAFAATRGVTMPRALRTALKEDGRDLVDEFRKLAPHRNRISIQRWSWRRIAVTVQALVVVALVLGLLVANLANLGAP
jgi:tRNA A-37 threonylcarbamoyl transferase component Bud32/membrane-associated phospholipid phosphatase